MQQTIQVGKHYKTINPSTMWNAYPEGTVVIVTKVKEGSTSWGEDYHRVEPVVPNGEYSQALCTSQLEELVSDPVEIAKANLAKAEAELKAAEEAKAEAERKSKEFTEDDVKTLMIVRNKDTQELRMITTNYGKTNAVSHSTTGQHVNSHKDAEFGISLLEWLNFFYEKTNLTLKDFANA